MRRELWTFSLVNTMREESTTRIPSSASQKEIQNRTNAKILDLAINRDLSSFAVDESVLYMCDVQSCQMAAGSAPDLKTENQSES